MSIFSSMLAGGTVKSIERIASEWIETDLESAEAKVLMVKTLDPNGRMRVRISDRVTDLYTLYVLLLLLLLTLEFFGFGGVGGASPVAVATEKLNELFAPITVLFGAIVSASFGVNYVNTKHNK